jgi:hypothetical protein
MLHASRSIPVGRVILLTLLALAFCTQAAHSQNIYQKKTTVKAVIAGSHNLYDGTFIGSGVSSICGEIPKMSSLTGVDTFVIEYPNDDPGNSPIQSVSFGSKQLVGKRTTGPLFTLSVAVRKPDGGKPYAYVLNTDPASPKNTGTSSITRGKNFVTIKVKGSNERGGETIDFTITCNY